MTTASTLITEIRQYVRDTSDNSGAQLFTDNEILGYLNRSINELCYKTDINVRTYEYIVNTGALSDVRIVPFTTLTGGTETGLFEQRQMLMLDSGAASWYDLRVVNAKNLRIYRGEATVKVVEVYDDLLHFNTDLTGDGTTGDTIAISGRWLKTNLTAVGNTYPLDIASEHASVAYACAFANYKKQSYEAGDRWLNMWADRLNEIKLRLKKNQSADLPEGLSLSKRPIEYASSQLGRSIPVA